MEIVLRHILTISRRPRSFWRGSMLSVMLLVVLMWQAPICANGSFDIQSDGDLISVSANNASLVAISDRLSELTGIPITYTEGNDIAVTLEIVGEPIEDVIDKLSKNSMIVRKTVDGNDVISEIVVMLEGDGGGAVSANLPTGEPAEGVIVGEEAPQELIPPAINPEQQVIDQNAQGDGTQTPQQPVTLEDGTVMEQTTENQSDAVQ